MDSLLPFFLLCFTSFFTLTNPLGTMPVFLTMTNGMSGEQRRAIVCSATIVSFLTLMVFTFSGQFLFKFFGISTNGFRIAGGIIIFTIGFDMLQARYAKAKLKEEEVKTYVNDISITPLAIPMRAGCDRQCLDADGRCRDIGKEVHLDRDDRIDLFYHLPDPPRFHTSEPLHRRDGQ